MEKPVRAEGTNSARIIQVIETTTKRGLGTKEDPVRMVIQYWDFKGEFLAEMDVQHCIPLIEHDAKAIRNSIVSG